MFPDPKNRAVEDITLHKNIREGRGKKREGDINVGGEKGREKNTYKLATVTFW